MLGVESRHSLIVFGPSQSGKTTGIAVPAITAWPGPVLAMSVKSDLLAQTHAARALRGPVLCFDPTESTGQGNVRWSPLIDVLSWPDARRTAAALAEGSMSPTSADGEFWHRSAVKLLAPLLLAATLGRRTLADVVRWVDLQETEEAEAILAAAGVEEAGRALVAVLGREERQRSSVAATLEAILEPFAGHASAVEHPMLDPLWFCDPGATLHLCAPGHDQRRLAPLFLSVVRQTVERAYERVARTGRPLLAPLLIVLDEAANTAALDDLDALATTAAAQGIQLVTIWHDMAQLSDRYGTRAATVVNNHRAKLFLAGIADPTTAEYVSALCGEEVDLEVSHTRARGSGPSSTTSPRHRPLLAPDALRQLPVGTGVLIYGTLPPARIRLMTES